MPETLDSDLPEALTRAVEALQAGGAVVLPTDTVYGVGTLLPDAAVLYELKGRPDSVPIAVLVASAEQAAELVDLTGTGERLALAFWPGPLTIVVPRLDGTGTLGVRCPAHPFVVALAARVGPLAVTSANRHGEPTPPTAAEAAAALIGDVALVVDGGRCAGVASTVVDATDATVRILRQGGITEEQVRAVALR